jgi:hypothetical protein
VRRLLVLGAVVAVVGTGAAVAIRGSGDVEETPSYYVTTHSDGAVESCASSTEGVTYCIVSRVGR